VGKLALTTGKKQKRKVATSEQALLLMALKLPLLGFTSVSEYSLANKKAKRCNAALLLMALKHPLLGFTSSTSLCYLELNVSEYSLANKKAKICNAALLSMVLKHPWVRV